ncbi:MAG TPA: YetF domain-containing protein [Thermoanaerobaculia bacterium]
MDAVLRAAAVYLFLLLVMRITGKRSLSQVTMFDFVLLLIIAETTQQALLGDDFSVTNCFLLVLTLMALDKVLVLLKQRSKRIAVWSEGLPLILVEHGEVHQDRLDESQVDVGDILAAARELQGLERLEQIKYAVLERHGGITVVPVESAR